MTKKSAASAASPKEQAPQSKGIETSPTEAKTHASANTHPSTSGGVQDVDKVGYGNPPKQTRWKKGQSGNPKGKPKHCKNIKTVVTDLMTGKMTVKLEGKPKTMSTLQALLHSLVVKAFSGNMQAAKLLIEFAKQYMPDEVDGSASTVSAEDIALLKNNAALLSLLDEIAQEGVEDSKDKKGGGHA